MYWRACFKQPLPIPPELIGQFNIVAAFVGLMNKLVIPLRLYLVQEVNVWTRLVTPSALCFIFTSNSNLFRALQLFYAYRHATLTA